MNDQQYVLESGAAGTSSTYATIGTIILDAKYQELLVEVANGGASAEDLTNFRIQRQASATANWVSWLAGTDFQTCTDTLRESLTDSDGGGLYVNELPDGTYCQFRINVRCAYAIRFQAMTASSTPTITITGCAVTF